MKFVLAARRKREDSQERYFYEWGIVHVALMLSTPAVMRTFRRYVQHYSVNGVPDDGLIHPLSAMEWDNMAEHVITSEADFDPILYSDDYVTRMQPHRFGDPNFVVELLSTETVFEEPGFAPGGLKLVHFLKRRPHLSHAEFAHLWREEHAPVVLDAARPLLRKYVQNPHLPLDPALFGGTLFEKGGVGYYSGMEEFWFRSLDDLIELRRNSDIFQAITASEAKFIDPAGSFSMVVMERVIYDFMLPEGQRSPLPAVLIPGTLEHQVYGQGLRDWNRLPEVTRDEAAPPARSG